MNIIKSCLIICLACLIFSSCDDEAAQPQPTVSSLSITQGVVGTNVTITGTNFGTVAADVEVFFNTTEAVVSVVSATTITTTVPTGATSGVVKVKVKTLEASGPSFTVLVPVTINVSPLSITINENPINGGLLGTINATTNRGNLTYSLASQSVAGAMTINSTTGILTVANVAAFDFEVNPTITGVVTVSNGSESATANITITLNNVVDVALSNFSAAVVENRANSTVIGTMNITTGSGTFAITSQTPLGALQINSTSGQLTVLNSSAFNFEANPTISATVSLTGGSEVKTASVTISLTDITEVNLSNFSLSIAENPSLNTVIGTAASFASIPNGVGGSIQYSIISQTPAGAMAINTSTGQLTVANVSAFDFETNPIITASIAASNQSETKNATATITVTDVNEAPPSITITSTRAAGSDDGQDCSVGVGSNVRFTNPMLGEVLPVSNTFKIYVADLTCGVREVTFSSTGTPSSVNIHTNGGGFIMVDVVRIAGNYLASYYDPNSGVGNLLHIPANGSAVTNFVGNGVVTWPSGLANNGTNIFVASLNGRYIKKFSLTGVQEAFYGSGAIGGADGAAGAASFQAPSDLQVDGNGNIFVADKFAMRKINATGVVSTYVGNSTTSGDVDGTATAARFSELTALGLMSDGSMVVADYGNGKIKHISTSGTVTTLLTNTTNKPRGIIVESNTTFYYTLEGKSAIYKAVLSFGGDCEVCR